MSADTSSYTICNAPNVYMFVYILIETHIAPLIDTKTIFTSLAKEVMFLVALVSLSVCLSVCLWTTLLKKLRTD